MNYIQSWNEIITISFQNVWNRIIFFLPELIGLGSVVIEIGMEVNGEAESNEKIKHISFACNITI